MTIPKGNVMARVCVSAPDAGERSVAESDSAFPTFEGKTYLTAKDAARFLSLSVTHLEYMRRLDRKRKAQGLPPLGPPHSLIIREARYSVADLIAWLESRKSHSVAACGGAA